MGRAELRDLAEVVLRDELGAVAVRRLCPRCGSAEHGRPYVVVDSGSTPQVSLSYAEGLVAVAWADGPVGIDIEDDGPPVDGVDRRAWSREEALFKADAEVRTEAIDVPEGYVGTVAGTGVSWRLAGPAAAAR
jgi:hypothetical protein